MRLNVLSVRPDRRSGLPELGSLWRRNSDGVLFEVTAVFTRDFQVRLQSRIPGAADRTHPFLPQLLRDYTEERL